jgi:hypothetical protein
MRKILKFTRTTVLIVCQTFFFFGESSHFGYINMHIHVSKWPLHPGTYDTSRRYVLYKREVHIIQAGGTYYTSRRYVSYKQEVRIIQAGGTYYTSRRYILYKQEVHIIQAGVTYYTSRTSTCARIKYTTALTLLGFTYCPLSRAFAEDLHASHRHSCYHTAKSKTTNTLRNRLCMYIHIYIYIYIYIYIIKCHFIINT